MDRGRGGHRGTGQPAGRGGDGGHGHDDRHEHDQARPHAARPPGKITQPTAARLTKPKNSSTPNCGEPRVAVRQTASASHSTAALPLHHVIPSRKRRSELPGVRVGCQLIDLPQAPSQMANTCAQPRAIPSGQIPGPKRDRCHSGYSTNPVNIAGSSTTKFRSLTWPGRKASRTIGMTGPKNVTRAVYA